MFLAVLILFHTFLRVSDEVRIEILHRHYVSMLHSRFIVFTQNYVISCFNISKLGWKCDTICAHFVSFFLASGTHRCGLLAHFTNLSGLLVDSTLVCAEEKLLVMRDCKVSPPAGSIVSGSSTKRSVNRCTQSGKESPPAFARVACCLVTARNCCMGLSCSLSMEIAAFVSSRSLKRP